VSASLFRADLTGADLTGAGLSLADLGGATLPDGSGYVPGTDLLRFGAWGTPARVYPVTQAR
jgi:uncharacterized protein YjbI with pentapeptide repeats